MIVGKGIDFKSGNKHVNKNYLQKWTNKLTLNKEIVGDAIRSGWISDDAIITE